MPTMNETSTITLPEYHNLLALLLLNLNTPGLLFLYHTRRRDDQKKKEERQCSHRTRCKTAEQSRSSSTRSRQRSRPYTQDTPSKRETSVTPKKERQTKPVYHHEHANTNHTPERRITPTITQPTQNPKTKKKNHTTHSRLTNHSTPRLQPTQTHIQSSSTPHTNTPAFIIPTPYSHTFHTPTDTC